MKLYYSIAHPSEIIGNVALGHVVGPISEEYFNYTSGGARPRSNAKKLTGDSLKDYNETITPSTKFVIEYDDKFNPVKIEFAPSK